MRQARKHTSYSEPRQSKTNLKKVGDLPLFLEAAPANLNTFSREPLPFACIYKKNSLAINTIYHDTNCDLSACLYSSGHYRAALSIDKPDAISRNGIWWTRSIGTLMCVILIYFGKECKKFLFAFFEYFKVWADCLFENVSEKIF